MNNLFLLLIPIVAAVILGLDIGSFPLISPDEPRYAETAREMLERADFITPYCDYLPRFDKPILFYWFEVLSLKFFGLNEFAARLPSVLAGAGMVWLAFLLGNIQGFGLVAAAMMLTSLQIFLFSKLAITDMTLAFFISAAIAFFYLGYRERQEIQQKFALKEKQSSAWFWLSLVMMAFGMLCKGPVAVLLPLVVIFIFLVLEKDLFDFLADTWMELSIGFGLFLLISVPWYMAVHFATAGKFTYEFFMGHNLSRYLNVLTNHAGPIWYYIPVIIVGLFPWSFFLIQALFSNDHSTKFNLRAESAKAAHLMSFCSLWATIILLFFSISQTKLPTYIMPIYLPLIVIVAKWWSEKFKTLRSNGYKNIDGLIGLALMVLTVFIGAVLGLFVFKKKLLEMNSSSVLACIAIISFVLIAAALVAMTAMLYKAKVAFAIISGVSLVCYLVSTHYILRPFAIYRDAGAKAFSLSLKPEDKLVTYKTHATVFSFYAERPVAELDNKGLFKYLTDPSEKDTKYFVAKFRCLPEFDKYLTNPSDNKNLAKFSETRIAIAEPLELTKTSLKMTKFQSSVTEASLIGTNGTVYEMIKKNKVYAYGKIASHQSEEPITEPVLKH